MNRLIKYGLYGLVSCILIALIVAVSISINPNIFKPLITQWVKENKHRTLILDGDIQLKFYPELSIKLGQFSLSDYKQETISLTVAHSYLSLSLLPLLQKQLVINEVTIVSPHATLIRFKNGRTNFDDLITQDDEAKQSEFDIDNVHIENATLIFQDNANNRVITLIDLDIETGHILPSTLDNLILETRGQTTSHDTSIQHDFDITFNVIQVQLDNDQLSSGKIDLNIGIANPKYNLLSSLSISNITSTNNQFESNSITAKLTAKQAAETTQINLSTSLVGNQMKQTLTLPNLTADLNTTRSNLPNPNIHSQLSGSLSIDALAEHIEMNLLGEIEDSTFEAMFNIANFTKPVVNFNVAIDRLNLDRFMPPSSQAKTNVFKQVKKNHNTTKKLDLASLKNLNANGLVHIGTLHTGNIQSSDLRFTIQSDESN